jgi:hypothetical protein
MRQMIYAYYDGSQAHGLAGNLLTATISDGSGNAIAKNYYRSNLTGGSAGALAYGLGLSSIERVEAAHPGSSFDSLTDAQIGPFPVILDRERSHAATLFAVA